MRVHRSTSHNPPHTQAASRIWHAPSALLDGGTVSFEGRQQSALTLPMRHEKDACDGSIVFWGAAGSSPAIGVKSAAAHSVFSKDKIFKTMTKNFEQGAAGAQNSIV